jgi:hypothetical protein
MKNQIHLLGVGYFPEIEAGIFLDGRHECSFLHQRGCQLGQFIDCCFFQHGKLLINET